MELEEQLIAFQRKVRSSELLAPAYGFYAFYAILIVCGVAASLWFITRTDNVFVQLGNALFLAFVLVQAGMLGHDLSHGQVLRSRTVSAWIGLFVWGLFGGLSETAWYEKHTAHHRYTNHIGKDPDLDIPFLFSTTQLANSRPYLKRLIVPLQHILFFLALPLIYFGIMWTNFLFVYRSRSWHTLVEMAAMSARFATLGFLVFAYLPLITAFIFIFIHLFACGVYMSLVFAPNHKGLEVIEANKTSGLLSQITLTRNIYPSRLIFYIFGGLNFQIEHHLFPYMPRPNYWRAQPLVKAFCKEHGIHYQETTWVGSLRDMYKALKMVANHKA